MKTKRLAGLCVFCCLIVSYRMDDMEGNSMLKGEHVEGQEQQWQSFSSNKLTKFLKLTDDDESKEKNKKSKYSKWQKVAEGPSFWKKELRKAEIELKAEAREVRLLEGSSVTLNCPEVEGIHDLLEFEAHPLGWMRNAKYVEEDSVDMDRITYKSPFILKIYPASVKESGHYECYNEDKLIGQVTLEILTMKEALLEGLTILLLTVAVSFPVYFVLSYMAVRKVKPIKGILYEEDSELDADIDTRISQLAAIIGNESDVGRKAVKRKHDEIEDESN